MNRIGVLQIIDTLDAGGLERVAVNVANHLPGDWYRSHLCTTRAEGTLAELVAPHVQRLRLTRSGRFDRHALRHLAKYIRAHDIRILHAHGSSLFIAAAAACGTRAAVVWHDHFGRYATEQRPAWLYWLATRRVAGVIAVNQPLADWSRRRLRVVAERVWYLPNFVCEPAPEQAAVELPGRAGLRVVCVANLRPEKDHLNLLEAMRLVVREVPAAHLLLVGLADNADYRRRVLEAMRQSELVGRVTWLGARPDVSAVLRGSDIGVLSSASEGLPLSLLEYGMHALPAVATRVGQCAEVLDDGRAGLLVPSSAPQALAAALVALLRSSLQQRQRLGQAFQQRVRHKYSSECVMRELCGIYRAVLPASGSHVEAVMECGGVA